MTDYSMDRDLTDVLADGSAGNIYYKLRADTARTRFLIEFDIYGSPQLLASGNIRIEESDYLRARDRFAELHDLLCRWSGMSHKAFRTEVK